MSSRSPRTPTKTEKEPTPYRALQYLMIGSGDKRKEFMRFYKYGTVSNAKFVKLCAQVISDALGYDEAVDQFSTPGNKMERAFAKIDPSTPKGKKKLRALRVLVENENTGSGSSDDADGEEYEGEYEEEYDEVPDVSEEDEVEEMDIPKKKKKKVIKTKSGKKN